MYCKQCGSPINDDSKFCSSCGYKFIDSQSITPSEAQNGNARSKKKDKLTNVSLVLSAISTLFSIGLIFEAPFLIVLGLLILIPAFLISTIALIMALFKRKKETSKNNVFKKRIISSCLSTAFPIFVLLAFFIFQNPINYSKAMKSFEEKDYVRANELFSNLENYKDSKEMANECDYLTAIDLAQNKEWKEARTIFEALAADNYKGSKALAIYCDAWVQADIRITMAENDLINQLKNPSSYQASNRTWSYTLTDRSSMAIDLHMSIQIEYSATNSFGGRVTDTYSSDANVVLSNTHGYTAKQVEEILGKSITEIASDYNK